MHDRRLAQVIEDPVAGYWGLSVRGAKATQAARVVRNGDVGKDGRIPVSSLPIRYFTPKEVTKAEVRREDAVLVSSGAYTGNVGRVVGRETDLPVIASNFVRRLRAGSDIDHAWLFHLLRSSSTQKHVWPHTGGSAIPNLGSSFYRGCPVPFLPLLPEQRRIAEILDTVDEAIRKTEEIIAKLKQVKQGLLHDLLTRGIDDNGELRDPDRHPEQFKDSPLGRIPEAWEVRTFGEVAEDTTLGTGKRGRSGTDDDIPLIKMGNLGWGSLDLTTVELVARAHEPNWSALLLRDGDLLFNTRNTPELVGKTAAWRGEIDQALADNNILRARFGPKVSGVFLAHFMGNGAGRRSIGRLATGTTSVAAIYWKSLRGLRVPIPTRAEQDAVVAAVDAHDGRVVEEARSLSKLRELKQGLMEDLLTGRVRVTALLEGAAE